MTDHGPTCRRCPNRAVSCSADPAHQILCEYEGWITPRPMRGCQHLQHITCVRDDDEPGDGTMDDEIPDGERLV